MRLGRDVWTHVIVPHLPALDRVALSRTGSWMHHAVIRSPVYQAWRLKHALHIMLHAADVNDWPTLAHYRTLTSNAFYKDAFQRVCARGHHSSVVRILADMKVLYSKKMWEERMWTLKHVHSIFNAIKAAATNNNMIIVLSLLEFCNDNFHAFECNIAAGAAVVEMIDANNVDGVEIVFEKYPDTRVRDLSGAFTWCGSYKNMRLMNILIKHVKRWRLYVREAFVGACFHGHVDFAIWCTQHYTTLAGTYEYEWNALCRTDNVMLAQAWFHRIQNREWVNKSTVWKIIVHLDANALEKWWVQMFPRNKKQKTE
jgi:hypothetical protein